MKKLILAAAIAAMASGAYAEPVLYKMDAPHTQVLFSWNHFGFSQTMAMFAGIEGEIIFDEEDPASSSVTASFPASSVFTGWAKRDETFQSEEFFNSAEHKNITFKSTSILVTGLDTANITGDLTAKGVTVPVVLHTTMNKSGVNPVYKTPVIGFTATAKLLRSDFGLERLIPSMGNEISITISAEAAIPKPE